VTSNWQSQTTFIEMLHKREYWRDVYQQQINYKWQLLIITKTEASVSNFQLIQVHQSITAYYSLVLI